MKQHQLKTLPEYYEALRTGVKKFEIRKNDRDFKVGDVLLLFKYENGVEDKDYCQMFTVTYLTNYAQKKGYVVMGIERRGMMI